MYTGDEQQRIFGQVFNNKNSDPDATNEMIQIIALKSRQITNTD